MRRLALGCVIAMGCRIDFDARPPADVETDADPLAAFRAGCVLGAALDEPRWTGVPGEVKDSCGTNHGTAVSGAMPIADPVRGPVGQLPLPSGCIQVPDAPALHATTALTLSAWIYPEALDEATPFGIIAKRTDFTIDDAEYSLFLWTGNTIWIDLDSRNDRGHGNAKVVNGRWQLVTMVYDGTRPATERVALYLDGALDATLPETSATIAPRTSPLAIGCLPEQPATKPQLALGGRLDAVGIWTRAFTAAEVANYYQLTRR